MVFDDDLEEPYILPDFVRFLKMCRTGSLGDYLGLPTFGTSISSTIKLVDKPCSANSRNFTDVSLSSVMKVIRSDGAVPSAKCASSLNSNGTQTVYFKTSVVSTAIPTNISQVGVDVTLTGGSAQLFEGCGGFLVFRGDDDTYNFEHEVTLTKSPDGVLGCSISSVDPSRLGHVVGGLDLYLS